MKTLYLVRHAKSDRGIADLEDIDRPLNARGYINAHAMGKILKEKKYHPELIVSSPAVRAISTALIFARIFKHPLEKIKVEHGIYEADPDDCISTIRQLDNTHKSVMLFGHNPTLTFVVNKLTEFNIEHLPTTAVVCIDFTAGNWNDIEKGQIRFFDFPKNHEQ